MSLRYRNYTERIQHALRHNVLFHELALKLIPEVKGGIYGSFGLAFLENLALPVKLDTIVTISSVSMSNPQNFPITIGNNAKRALLVFLSFNDSSPGVSVSCGAATGTQIAANYQTGGGYQYAFIILNPPSGSQNVTVVPPSATDEATGGIYSLYNVNQTIGYNSSNLQNTGNGGNSNNPVSLTLTPARGSFVIDFWYLINNFTGTPNKTQAWVQLGPASNLKSMSQYDANPTGASETFTWGTGGAFTCWGFLIEIIHA